MFDSAPESVLRLTYWVEPDYESVHKSMQTRSGITTSTIEEMFRETLINIGSVVDVTVSTCRNPFRSLLTYENIFIRVRKRGQDLGRVGQHDHPHLHDHVHQHGVREERDHGATCVNDLNLKSMCAEELMKMEMDMYKLMVERTQDLPGQKHVPDLAGVQLPLRHQGRGRGDGDRREGEHGLEEGQKHGLLRADQAPLRPGHEPRVERLRLNKVIGVNKDINMTTDENKYEERILCCLLCARMVLISDKSMIDFVEGDNIPLKPETTFRVVYCAPCSRKFESDAKFNTCTVPGSALSASMIVNWRLYMIVNNVLGHDGFMRLNKSKEKDAYLIESMVTNGPRLWKNEKVVSISIGSKLYMHTYKPNSFFNDEKRSIYVVRDEEDEEDMVVELSI
ncbi:hypothetical protein KXW62_008430 [Aspergillus fumigatus]|nr:hypothetical protein KXW62_008430 [Aspergillus fumigatus]